MTFAGTSDSSDPGSAVDFTSSTQSRIQETEVPLISTTDLTKLPKGQFFVMMDGNKLFKGRVPWLLPDRNDKVPNDIRLVATKMRDNYQSLIPNWYDFKEDLTPVKIFEDSTNPDEEMDKLRETLRDAWVDNQDMDFAMGSSVIADPWDD